MLSELSGSFEFQLSLILSAGGISLEVFMWLDVSEASMKSVFIIGGDPLFDELSSLQEVSSGVLLQGFAGGAVIAFNDAIGLWVGDTAKDMIELESLDQSGVFFAGVLAAMIGDDFRFGCWIFFQCRQLGQGDVTGGHGGQQFPMDDVAAVGINEADQKVPAVCQSQVHDIGMPTLVRLIRLWWWITHWPGWSGPSAEQPLAGKYAIDTGFAQADHFFVDHLPGQIPVTVGGMLQGKLNDRFPLPGQRGPKTVASSVTICKALLGCR